MMFNRLVCFGLTLLTAVVSAHEFPAEFGDREEINYSICSGLKALWTHMEQIMFENAYKFCVGLVHHPGDIAACNATMTETNRRTVFTQMGRNVLQWIADNTDIGTCQLYNMTSFSIECRLCDKSMQTIVWFIEQPSIKPSFQTCMQSQCRIIPDYSTQQLCTRLMTYDYDDIDTTLRTQFLVFNPTCIYPIKCIWP